MNCRTLFGTAFLPSKEVGMNLFPSKELGIFISLTVVFLNITLSLVCYTGLK